MKLSLSDMRSKYDALIEGSQSRADISAFAFEAMTADDYRRLELEKGCERRIWKAILDLLMADVEIEPGVYLRHKDDFILERAELEDLKLGG